MLFHAVCLSHGACCCYSFLLQCIWWWIAKVIEHSFSSAFRRFISNQRIVFLLRLFDTRVPCHCVHGDKRFIQSFAQLRHGSLITAEHSCTLCQSCRSDIVRGSLNNYRLRWRRSHRTCSHNCSWNIIGSQGSDGVSPLCIVQSVNQRSCHRWCEQFLRCHPFPGMNYAYFFIYSALRSKTTLRTSLCLTCLLLFFRCAV